MQKRGRKFSILDGMIVVAATAISFAWTRSEIQHILRFQVGIPAGIRFSLWIPIPIPSLVSATIAVLVLRSRRPRPRWRQLVYQPGTVACAGIILVAALQAVLFALALGLNQIPALSFDRSAIGPQIHPALLHSAANWGLAVIGVWLALVCVRRWRAEDSWIDRAGRIIGSCWIAMYFVQQLIAYMLAT
jgi:hypothetical protein